MQKRAPTLGNIVVIILFVLSCFGLLMFLWGSFGGPLPLKPKGYRITVSFPRAFALAEQSDVKISGVDVGHVIALKTTEGRTDANLEIAGKYAPIRANSGAILRVKTLLGETYVELIPHGQTGPYLADNGHLPDSHVLPSVTLDDILAAFDPRTRAAFGIWQQAVAAGINGRGEQINAAFASLQPFVEHTNQLVSLLATQEGALHLLVRNTGVTFNALASRDNQLEQFIVNGERTFHALAEGSTAFAEAFEALPTFEKRSTVALKELDKLSVIANPYLIEFRKAQRELSSLLEAAKPFAPQFDTLMTSLGPLTAAAKVGVPKIKTTLDLTTPVLENLRPVLHNLDPFLQYTSQYVPEVQAFFSNLAAATQGQAHSSNAPNGRGPKLHELTTMSVLSPESLTLYGSRIGTDRANAYPLPGSYKSLASGLSVFSSSACANSAPSVSGPANESVSEELIKQIQEFKVANTPETPNAVPAPACNQQGPFTFDGKTSQFPQVASGSK